MTDANVNAKPEEPPSGAPAGRSSHTRVLLIVAGALVCVLIVVLGVTWMLTSLAKPAPSPASPASSALSFSIPSAGSSSKKVFAHYFPPYPISLDNLAPATDYYARNYLSPDGEHGAFAAVGGLLRDRPLGVAPRSGDWRTENLVTEVNQAANAGIDGFTVDILGLSGQNWDTVSRLMDAAVQSGRAFAVVPNLDVTASAGSATPEEIAAKLAQLYASPSAYRLPDGRYVLSSFKAEGKPVAWWSQIIGILAQNYGIRIAFIAVLLDASSSNMQSFAPISYALGSWGSRTVQSVNAAPDLAAQAHALGVKWMAPVAVQDVRPRSELYAEASNTATLRAMWNRASTDDADLVQLVTWNDYSEGTSFAPSVAHGDAFLDINAYYLVRFKTGRVPTITHDSLYITHRIQLFAARPLSGSALMEPDLNCCAAPRNTVEVLTMLTRPGTVQATIGGKTYTANAKAGLSTVTFPLAVGTISASVLRDGTVVLNVTSPHAVVAKPPVQDLQYYAVSSRKQR